MLTVAACCQLPLWAVVSFGAYSLASIGYNLFIFRECPEAFSELEQVDHNTALLGSHMLLLSPVPSCRSTDIRLCAVCAMYRLLVQDLKAARSRLTAAGFKFSD